ncbi:uncharacterized protein EDB93DRAFT_109724 [Suillus bovinus]|uniref:uncharacterized protein n=1 Tax=Suillus bovinus TaxID=48563 RepID=UPI001B87E686|nr:uncharacterized protein EDB93DRAFT_109724 [Suillus bovinus]KAG2129706.1 hypothetical protein EDB93DRAFT_109724 [Suillus bovinus]
MVYVQCATQVDTCCSRAKARACWTRFVVLVMSLLASRGSACVWRLTRCRVHSSAVHFYSCPSRSWSNRFCDVMDITLNGSGIVYLYIKSPSYSCCVSLRFVISKRQGNATRRCLILSSSAFGCALMIPTSCCFESCM